MMHGMQCCPVTMALVPTSILLTVSFFVLVALRKMEQSALKTFGLAVAVLLWVTSALVLANGMLQTSDKSSKYPMMGGKMMHEKMGMMKESGMSGPMMKEKDESSMPEHR